MGCVDYPETRKNYESDLPGHTSPGVFTKGRIVQEQIDDRQGEQQDQVFTDHGQEEMPCRRMPENDGPRGERGDDEYGDDPEGGPARTEGAALVADHVYGVGHREFIDQDSPAFRG